MVAATRKGARGRRTTRRIWCIPPAITRDPDDAVEGDHVLNEVGGGLGLLLWRTFRDVALWAETPEELRADVFSSEGASARLGFAAGPELPSRGIAVAVETVHAMFSPEPPAADPHVLAACCLEIAEWARTAGYPRTAIGFAQAGSLAVPTAPEAALRVGVLARAAGQDARAETWLRRAVALARHTQQRPGYPQALLELGALFESRKNIRSAERFYRMASLAGGRFGARDVRMHANHRRFQLALQRDDRAGAKGFAVKVQRAFVPTSEGAPELLVDLARFWTDAAEPRRARSALRRVWPYVETLPNASRLAACALSARAFQLANEPARLENAARLAWELIGDLGIPGEERLRAVLDLAHAARQSEDAPAFQRARRAAMLLARDAEVYEQVVTALASMWPAYAPRERAP
jgi:hypothetical protein